MKRLITLSSIALSLFTMPSILAETVPASVLADLRIKQVPYQKNNVVPIEGQAFVNTQVVFGEDEVILDVQGGDEAGWTYHIDKNIPNILNIKPTLPDSDSNLDVITTDQSQQRIYRFHLMMGSQMTKENIDSTYAIEFIYPDKNKEQLQATLDFISTQQKSILNAAKSPKDYNWHYSFHGDRSIMPVHVFDDGRFTYLELRVGQDIPSIFSVDNSKGEESVVNTRREGNYVIIQKISPQLTLRLGSNKVASIFNNKAINKLHGVL